MGLLERFCISSENSLDIITLKQNRSINRKTRLNMKREINWLKKEK